MRIGVDYYPEHWAPERWETDARLMKEAGFNVVRLAEFAWADMEPEEGVFDFAWLDKALDILGRNGIAAILGTPTCSMPAWAKEKYPESMATDKSGRRVEWGVRANYCSSSGSYRLLSERITRAMAGHYKDSPHVIGWQTHNEFDAHQCFCGTCRKEFHSWLKRRHGSLESLNKAWGTHFWNHNITDWSQIPLPVDGDRHNPGLCLDWKRFVSFLDVRFQAEQLKVLRELCPEHFATHNFMGLFCDINYYDLAKDLDFVSWDNYPVDNVPPGAFPVASSMAADVMRGLKDRNFWIMEQTAGPHGWGSFGRNVRPGELRKIAFQQVSRGADGMVWFRWRSCTAGREQYWHGLLGHDGKALRRYEEAARTARDLHALAPALEGTKVDAKIAFIYDYESIWAMHIQPGNAGNDCRDRIQRLYAAVRRAGVDADMVPPGADLSKYKAVFAPALYIMPDALARKLDKYVKGGGVLLCDGRTGVKDADSLCHERTLPGLLSDALGISIEEYESVAASFSYTVSGGNELPGDHVARRYCDWVKPGKAETLASYKDWHLEGYAAATRCAYGKGFGFYLGCEVEDDAFYDSLAACVLKAAKVGTRKLPKGVEASVRAGQGRRLLFLVNHTEEPVEVEVPEKAKALSEGSPVKGGSVKLGRFGVAVLELS